MAGANQRQTFVKRVNTSEGHYARWEVSLRDLHLLHTWQFKKKQYQTFCGTSPSSWYFEMWCPEVRPDGTASLSVFVNRKDTLDVQLEATVWVDIGDIREDLIYPKQSFTKSEMGPGSEMRELVELQPLPGMAAAVNHNIIAIVILMISSCHTPE